ncbi:serine/threonine-protein kinase Chk1-like isoform X2 [Tigriopus californicus]|nr:serine/threonine-protein kinase Chk1-like isoform X2 [Tigriopus californicus]
MREFIEGWHIMQILGEGTFAEVNLLVNQQTGEACAMKQVWVNQSTTKKGVSEPTNLVEPPPDFLPMDSEKIQKEIALHKVVKHENIVNCYGARLERNVQFIFLEYCNGGELFDRIEPGLGMPENLAQSFFLQLISAVEYLHSIGIVHRDIKPENILLTDGDVLKLTDFGLATVFRHKGKERKLERPCGTMPYMAPELFTKSTYQAEPCDIWCCGVVLMAMLVGELPWSQALPHETSYVQWKNHEYTRSPYQRLGNLPLSLLRKMLAHSPSQRYSIQKIKNHLWCKTRFTDDDGNMIEPVLVRPHHLRNVNPDEVLGMSQPANLVFSQKRLATPNGGEPPLKITREDSNKTNSRDKENQTKSILIEYGALSQPARLSMGYSGTQMSNSSQSGGDHINHYQRLVKRMTRFWVDTGYERTEQYLKSLMAKMGIAIVRKARGIFVIESKDVRGSPLVYKCTFIQIDGKILVDFRLIRGCGLEFKRTFAHLKANCEPILDKAPILWTNLVAPDSIPVA